MTIHIISTAYRAPTRAKCEESVLACVEKWRGPVEVKHHYVEASEQSPTLCAIENFTNIARQAAPDDLLLSLDGDDWLAHDQVINIIWDVYQDPDVWMTYGSFVHADGREGFASQYRTEDFRGDDWRGTHLKTMRAALYQKLTDADLKRDGVYRDLAWDLTTMLPMLEMSGLAHSRFIKDVSYVYNFGHSWEHTAAPAEREREVAMVREIRSMPRRERLATL